MDSHNHSLDILPVLLGRLQDSYGSLDGWADELRDGFGRHKERGSGVDDSLDSHDGFVKRVVFCDVLDDHKGEVVVFEEVDEVLSL